MKNLIYVMIAMLIAGTSINATGQSSSDNNQTIEHIKIKKESVKVNGDASKKAKRKALKLKKMKMYKGMKAESVLKMKGSKLNSVDGVKARNQKLNKMKSAKLIKGNTTKE